MSSVAFKKIRVTWWRWPLAIVAAVVALALIVAGTLRPVSHAATGQKWLTGVPFAGYIYSRADVARGCTVTVVSEFMAITGSHCQITNPTLTLDLSALSTPGRVHAVKEFRTHPTLDVKAIFLRDRSGLTVTPVREFVEGEVFYAWGYGGDFSNNASRHLTRAEFNQGELCGQELPPDGGDLCWQTTAQNNICDGDSGGPVTQNGAIIAMVTGVIMPGGPRDCSKVVGVQALTIQQMQPWLNEMIDDASPFPT